MRRDCKLIGIFSIMNELRQRMLLTRQRTEKNSFSIVSIFRDKYMPFYTIFQRKGMFISTISGFLQKTKYSKYSLLLELYHTHHRMFQLSSIAFFVYKTQAKSTLCLHSLSFSLVTFYRETLYIFDYLHQISEIWGGTGINYGLFPPLTLKKAIWIYVQFTVTEFPFICD